MGLSLDITAAPVPQNGDARLHKVANNLLDIAADIADLGELCGLHLDEGSLGQPGKTARNLGLADTGRPDHQNVLRRHLTPEIGGQLLPAPAIAQGNGDGALGIGLTDNMAIELGDDLARGKIGFTHSWSLSIGALSRKRTIRCSSINRPFTKR